MPLCAEVCRMGEIMTADQFRNRPMETRSWTLCEECEQLRLDPDVQERKSYWPTFSRVCCSICFTKLIAEYQNVVAC